MAGFDAGSIVARVKADISDFKEGMENAQQHSSRFHNGLDKVAGGVKLLAKGLAVGGIAAAAFGTLATKEFMESENAAAQLKATLKSTGGVAGVTAKQALDLADSLSQVTKFTDEAVLGGENLLLTFTNIGKDIFPEATEVMLDMSQALGQDIKASAVQLGKALQDPIQGVTALRRVGVNFSEAQQEMIEKMVKAGDTMGAQKFILKELQTEFGGSARAAGDTFSGKLAIAKNNFSNLMETIGLGITEKLDPLIGRFNNWVQNAGGVEGAMTRVTENVKNFGRAVMDFLQPAIDLMIAAWKFLEPNVKALADTIMTELWPALKRLWDTISPLLIPALQGAAGALGVALLGAIWAVINILNFFVDIISKVIGFISNLIQWGKNVRQMFIDVAGTLLYWIPHAFSVAMAWIQNLQNKFGEIVGSIKRSLSGVYDAIVSPFKAAFDWVQNKVDSVVRKLKDLNPFQRHSPSLYDLVSKGTDAIKSEYAGMFGAIGDMATRFGAVSLAPALAGATPNQDNRISTQIYGNITIGSDADADNFMARLTTNTELARKGLAQR